MDLSATAWTAMILVVVFLSLTFAPNWSLAILILVGKIAQAFKIGKKTAEPSPGDPRNGHSDSGPGGPPPAPPGADEQAPPAPPAPPTPPTPSTDDPPDLENPPLTQSYYSFGIEHSAADASAPAVDAAGNTESEPGLSSTSSSSYAFKYDVYLNFGGQDIQHEFANHLYRRLVAEGISLFRDDHSIRETSLKVNKVIKQSRIWIVILSKNYAPNTWCLRKLVEMWEYFISNRQIMIPIFYDVSPKEVKTLTGDFGRSVERSLERLYVGEVRSDTMAKWEKVFREIGNLSGFHPTGNDGELIDRVVAHVAHLLKREDQVVFNKQVGIDLHAQEIMKKLGVAYGEGQAVEVRGEEVRIVGIWGEPDVGKTTIAKIVFNEMRELFDASIFLEDISLKEVSFSRQMLVADFQRQKPAPLESSIEGMEEIASLCCKAKVLIVLDNVNEDEEIRALAGKLSWFGPGSRIIVTTYEREVLRAFDVGADDRGTVEEYEVKSMDRGAPPPADDALAPTGKKGRNAVSSSMRSSLSGIKYEVFLNFRGTDTRTTITDHLFRSLVDAGISVFNGDKELHVEKEMGLGLKEAIKQSRISIAILSTDYASSEWCLMELVQMWECRKLNGQIIIPIFYNVSPSDVRHQARDFGEAFSLHEKRFDSETIKKWREVLGGIAELSGYSGKLYVGFEGQLAEEVVLCVARILRDYGLTVIDELFGIDHHVQRMMRKLGFAHSEGQETEVHGEDVRVIGICGEPGIGKTTLAKVVFNEMRGLFDRCSFLPGISSKGIQFLQNMLIADLQIENPAPLESAGDRIKEISSLCCNAKVLIVLDDVDGDEQIEALAGKLTWFGSGSRIIVTTRNKEVLSAFDVGANGHGTVKVHKIRPMSSHHASQLFQYHAFRGDAFKEDLGFEDEYLFGEVSKLIVKALGRVPKDIVHHASYFGRRRSLPWWRHKLIELLKLRDTGRLGGVTS